MICEAIQASSSVANGSATSVHSTVASRLRRRERVNSSATPITAASSSAIVTRSPPSRLRDSCTGAPNRGEESQGAAVWVAW